MLLKAEEVSYSYNIGTAGECRVLNKVSFDINEGEFIALIGSSGAGKTTLIKHLNGLLRATSGKILYQGSNIYDKKFSIVSMRREVGLVFQYPEHQLFSRTVFSDVYFGPLNTGRTKEETDAAAKEALELVGIDEELYSASPFSLSGGQMRCVAIAGVLAMAAQDSCRVLVLDEGFIKLSGTPKEVFGNRKYLEKIGTGVPMVTSITEKLIEEGIPLGDYAVNVDEGEKIILGLFDGKDGIGI